MGDLASMLADAKQAGYKEGEADMLRTIKKGIEKILRQYEADKYNVPKPDALSIYAYLVVLEDQL